MLIKENEKMLKVKYVGALRLRKYLLSGCLVVWLSGYLRTLKDYTLFCLSVATNERVTRLHHEEVKGGEVGSCSPMYLDRSSFSFKL